MLYGIDISHHNEATILKNPDLLTKSDFVIMKATEGINYIDKWMYKYLDLYHPYAFGFYHYARPEKGNSAIDEALHFTRVIHPYIGNAVFALDVEADALLCPDIDIWTLEWCEAVFSITGVRPMIYCSESQCYRFSKAAAKSYGLWCAKWSDKKPTKKSISPWKLWAIWQYEVSGVDRDQFNGDYSQWFAYCKEDRA